MGASAERLRAAKAEFEAGRHRAAMERVLRELARAPGDMEAVRLMVVMSRRMGEEAGAVGPLEGAVRARPRDAELRAMLGSLLVRVGKVEESIEHWREAVRVEPAHAIAQLVLGRLLAKADPEAALVHARRAYELRPDMESLGALHGVLFALGEVDEAIAVLRDAQSRLGASCKLQHSMMLPLLYSHRVSPEEVFAEHVRMGELLGAEYPEDAGAGPGGLFANDPDPDRPLRVGYVSQDFRNRSAAHFIEPVLVHADRERYRAYCYYNNTERDEMTERLEGCAEGWTQILGMSDRAVVERMRADKIDILLDLTGHTGMNRIVPFCYRGAPVQITYMAYPYTTGLRTMDYRIVDWVTDPAGSDRLATEELIRVKGCNLCYAPPGHAPGVSPAPCAASGKVTFGSFNTQLKINGPVYDAWSAVMKRVGGSRLLVKNQALGESAVAARTRGEFAARGIGAERLDLRGETKTKGAHMGTYAEIDIALDTFPYNGVTTTFEALWMGVPVVAMEGRHHISRLAMSILTHAGRGEWVGRTVEEYVGIACALAGDPARLASERAGMRERMRASGVCDGAGFAREFEGIYRKVWGRWCVRKRMES